MAKLDYVGYDVLRVTQDYLIGKPLKNYLKLNDYQHIPPIPVTRDMVSDGGWAVLDAHHFLASLRKKQVGEVPIWICDSPRDLFEIINGWDKDIVQDRNDQIKKRWNTAPFYVPTIGGNEIYHIDSLIDKGIY